MPIMSDITSSFIGFLKDYRLCTFIITCLVFNMSIERTLPSSRRIMSMTKVAIITNVALPQGYLEHFHPLWRIAQLHQHWVNQRGFPKREW